MPEPSAVGAAATVLPDAAGDEPFHGVRVEDALPAKGHALREAPGGELGEYPHRIRSARHPDRREPNDCWNDEVSELAVPGGAGYGPRLILKKPSLDLGGRLLARGRRVTHVGPPPRFDRAPGCYQHRRGYCLTLIKRYQVLGQPSSNSCTLAVWTINSLVRPRWQRCWGLPDSACTR